MYTQDTICALATAPGIAAISVIRVSGEISFEICDKIFRKNKNTDNTGKIPQKLTDMLLCPECKNLEGSLEISGNFLSCNFCGTKYIISDGILDLRLKN